MTPDPLDREIEALLAATREDWAPDIAAIAVVATQARQEPAERVRPMVPIWAAAACACLLLGYAAGSAFDRPDDRRAVSYDLMFGPGDGLGR